MQQPFFTSANGQSRDDIDFNEVFAEYFSNEYDVDPLNAYTNSMANFCFSAPSPLPPASSVHAAALEAGGLFQVPTATTTAASGSTAPGNNAREVQLPTGGIKTAFHERSIPKRNFPETIAPPHKRTKSEGDIVLGVGNTSAADPLKAISQANPHTTDSLSFGKQNQEFQQQIHSPAVNQPQQLGIVGATAAASPVTGIGILPGATNSATSAVPLPVGVGIKLGGLGGISPAVTQAAQSSFLQSQFSSVMTGGWNVSDQDAFADYAVAERRQRNREHAKRSRVRKKFMLESMQQEVKELQMENENLRMLIQQHLPELAQTIIAECCTTSPLFAEADEDGEVGAKLSKTDFSLIQSLDARQRCFVLSNPNLQDNPIVFASGGFYELTGYTPKEVLGRNCRFLQGPGTDQRALDVIRKALETGSDASVTLLNYKADGTPFWNQLFIAALRDSDNRIANYVGVQCEVEPEQEGTAVEDKVNEVLPLQNKFDEKDEEE